MCRKCVLFLGHASFYKRYIKGFSKTNHPLCKLLQKDVEFSFNTPYKGAFDILKEILVSAPIMQPPNWDIHFEIMCHASNVTVHAVVG